MSTVNEYHAYARDCFRWAARARTEEQRERLLVLLAIGGKPRWSLRACPLLRRLLPPLFLRLTLHRRCCRILLEPVEPVSRMGT